MMPRRPCSVFLSSISAMLMLIHAVQSCWLGPPRYVRESLESPLPNQRRAPVLARRDAEEMYTARRPLPHAVSTAQTQRSRLAAALPLDRLLELLAQVVRLPQPCPPLLLFLPRDLARLLPAEEAQRPPLVVALLGEHEVRPPRRPGVVLALRAALALGVVRAVEGGLALAVELAAVAQPAGGGVVDEVVELSEEIGEEAHADGGARREPGGARG
mmetsp:Transcript_15899/g.23935  ORF Transcript_15899/g.23935 Transcript_15899/m.23935 type:complete len:215 (-) Transcript_15899:57-701(-)